MSSSEAVPPDVPGRGLTRPAGDDLDTVRAAVPVPGLTPQRIAQRVAALDAVGELPLAEHVELYQRLHTELQSALAEIDGP